MFDRAFLAGKLLKGQELRVRVLKYVFVLLFGLVFGYVLQSAGFLVEAVDKFSRNDVNGAFEASSQGVGYVR